MTPTGLEGNHVSTDGITDLANLTLASAAQSGAVGAQIDPELAIVIQAWSGLRDDARECILEIARASNKPDGNA